MSGKDLAVALALRAPSAATRAGSASSPPRRRRRRSSRGARGAPTYGVTRPIVTGALSRARSVTSPSPWKSCFPLRTGSEVELITVFGYSPSELGRVGPDEDRVVLGRGRTHGAELVLLLVGAADQERIELAGQETAGLAVGAGWADEVLVEKLLVDAARLAVHDAEDRVPDPWARLRRAEPRAVGDERILLEVVEIADRAAAIDVLAADLPAVDCSRRSAPSQEA